MAGVESIAPGGFTELAQYNRIGSTVTTLIRAHECLFLIHDLGIVMHKFGGLYVSHYFWRNPNPNTLCILA